MYDNNHVDPGITKFLDKLRGDLLITVFQDPSPNYEINTLEQLMLFYGL